MQVKLLAYTPSPEATVACAAKLCYAQADIGTVQKGLTPEKTASFLEMLPLLSFSEIRERMCSLLSGLILTSLIYPPPPRRLSMR